MSHSYMVFLFIHHHGFSARVALMIARKATPTSANTAAHIFAKPRAPSTITMILTASANTMFCCTIRTVFLAIAYATAILPGSSSIKTMSAASIAASWPIAPIAIPTSARIKTGASLIPSPVKINVLSS